MVMAFWAAPPLHWKVLQCPGGMNSRLTQDSAPWLLWMCGREGAQESTETVKQLALGKTAKRTTVLLASVLSPFKTTQLFTNICLLFPQGASPMPCGVVFLAMGWLWNT